ncbi:MerR family transcriptional regulator [Paenibacillus sp. 1011MAR3C5]|uniref:MerR family transcriptional regulator n=1 Tax=Paenibacillus sp. 1011MAR3C5 TaxID=1675787 RepID=UPI000E6B9560|nr:MerR family transcriptional regulator [Paenibacillus sp. 1011MAR3C5]RJE87699.1 MerR family transcriptional regulator [Paenibacillus sp. 1011MAR3C5]
MESQSDAEKTYAIGAFAKLTGVTERTLRFYDRKELLTPSGRNAQGHRYYTERDLLRLQQILTLKYLDFSLEEIAEHFAEPGADLEQSLSLQYELLKKKRQQLDQAIFTIERLRTYVDGTEKLDSALLLMFIHNIQNEESQKQYLAERMPTVLVDAIYHVGVKEEVRLERERIMTLTLIELLSHCRAGKSPTDPEVLAVGSKMVQIVTEVLAPAISQLSEQELSKLEQEIEQSLDPVLFQISLSKEEETFVQVVMEELEKREKEKEIQDAGGNSDGN